MPIKSYTSTITNHPYILLTIAPLIWGGNAVIGRLATDSLSPAIITFLRWLVALVILLPVSYSVLRKEWSIIRKHLFLLLGYGAVGFGCFNILLYNSLHYTTAINVTLLQATVPMIILFMSRILFKERLKIIQVLGIVLAFFGVMLIISQGDIYILTHLSINNGDGMMLIATIMYACYSIALRYKPDVSWLSFICVAATGALIISIPFVAYEIATDTAILKISARSIGLLAYTAILASIVSQLAFAKGVSIIGASRAGLALNLVPIFGAILAVAILGESFHMYHLIALIAVLVGIGLSEYAQKSISS